MASEPDAVRGLGEPPVLYWRRGDASQNFGDFLSELFVTRAFVRPRVTADVFRVIGSVIDEEIIEDDLQQVGCGLSGKMGFWCCGARSDVPLADRFRQASLFFGVRGPLTRDVLGLPKDTVLGDPGFLLPLLHQPRASTETRGKAVCVPHFSDPKGDQEIIEASGAEVVVRPSVANDLEALTALLDKICSARFVLAGSLHAAIIACAYDVPFCFYDNGFVDVPFKWRDFAASVGLVPCFVDRVEDGIHLYDTLLSKRMHKPPLYPLLAVAPYYIQNSVLLKAAAHDALRSGAAQPDAAQLEHLSRLIDDAHARTRLEQLEARVTTLSGDLASAREDVRQLRSRTGLFRGRPRS